METYKFWTDVGDQDNIDADSLKEAAEKASQTISVAAWRDGAWGIVRGPGSEQMDVPSREWYTPGLSSGNAIPTAGYAGRRKKMNTHSTKTITIDGVRYAPVDERGAIQIVVLERGYIYVGQFENDGTCVTIQNARCIIRWGTTSHLGQLKNGPLETTKLGDACTVRCSTSQVIHCIEVDQDVWSSAIND